MARKPAEPAKPALSVKAQPVSCSKDTYSQLSSALFASGVTSLLKVTMPIMFDSSTGSAPRAKSSGWHFLQGRSPASRADSQDGKNLTFSGRGLRALQEGRQ